MFDYRIDITIFLALHIQNKNARHLPRAPLPTPGVTLCSVMSRTTSEGVTPLSKLIWAHEPDQNPLSSFGGFPRQRVLAGCCQSLLEDGPSRRYLCNPYMLARTHTPPRLLGAFTRFFPRSISLSLERRGSTR